MSQELPDLPPDTGDLRMRDTIVPPPDEDDFPLRDVGDRPTGMHHNVPPFVGEAPSDIPAAPPYFRDFMRRQEERDERRDRQLAEAMDSVTGLAKQMLDGNVAINANINLLREAAEQSQQENQTRHRGHEMRDRQLGERFEGMRETVDRIEREVADMKAKLALFEMRDAAEVP